MKKTIIIAEAGVNHNGDIKIAKQLIDVAAEAGADYVKFQTFKTEDLVTKDAQKAEYQLQSAGGEKTQYEMLKSLELSESMHIELVRYCNQSNIQFLSTPFDIGSINLLTKLGLQLFKIPSGEITNYPLIKKIAKLNKKIVLSTGMTTLKEVDEVLNYIVSCGTKKENVTILHCNTEYPTPMEDVNLKAMYVLKETLGVNVGYSDHSLGIEVPIAAVAMGATVIEKHFTLDRNMDGPDHRISLEPLQLKEMVKAIRNIEQALGDGVKRPSDSELKNKTLVRKSIVATRDIQKGEKFTHDNIICKRPGDGLPGIYYDILLQKESKRSYQEDIRIKRSEIE